MNDARLFIEGEWTTGSPVAALDKYDGSEIGVAHHADSLQVENALASLASATRGSRPLLDPYERYEVLARASRLLRERAAAITGLIVRDAGFAHADARREVERTADTLLLSAEAAKTLHGEVVPIDAARGGSRRLAFTTRHPLGVVCAITPFNSPLNTVAHKVGPALAAGNAVILKPASLTPFSAVALVEVLLDAGLPAELISLVIGSGSEVGDQLLRSDVPTFYAFTGSTEVGRAVRAGAGLRKTQLELGSLSSTIVCDDADLDAAAARVAPAAFRKAGQVCTSVQRLYVHESVRDEVRERLTAALDGLVAGDPRDEATAIGPLISPAESDRVHAWIEDARTRGARAIIGGQRDGIGVIQPTLIDDPPHDAIVMSHEIFGPVVNLIPFRDLDATLASVNDTPYGLAAGIFTRDIDKALDAAAILRMGSVHINETSSNRVDLMPYGGVKDSGSGVEGPMYAAREMTEERLITLGHASPGGR